MTIENLKKQIALAEENFTQFGITPDLQNKIAKVYDLFDTAFLHGSAELILHKKWNIFFRIDNIIGPDDFDYKLLSYCSFYVADNHFKKASKECIYMWGRLNRWFRREFTYEELQLIYCKLGSGANRNLGNDFIANGLDMSLLK